MTRTFTFILEFRGGTYISQHRGRYPREALRRWAAAESRRLVGGWQSGLTADVFEELEAQEVVPVTGMAKMWCVAATIDDEFALVNVVATAE